MIPTQYTTMIFGCGNVIMGDDGYGPAVVDKLNACYNLPDSVQAIDVGTCVREYLFDYLLSEEGRPDQIIILDAVDFPDHNPGDVFQIFPDTIPAKKIHDFSLHQFPTVNLLQELEQHTGIKILILAAQVKYIPEEIEPGLSSAMSLAVTEACEHISRILNDNVNGGDLL
ncbi:MAG: hydrogenase maturation protease [Proteobacteria bacterium]|jgi:coenzyme F420 hydrogenase subunit delta|nr:hydrogenase maturation protease [Desulfocapsa sp.]MBU3945554.1 hydrogenase maturation protease [Pseudomonadota bacterium]MCG2742970.1 hydrogenase maturation protease [Desulfobacteraceae bacterium]MBU3984138.1 hydrogenase maturation protease [Pseudomonadota bacterium]MBU4030405.1 hydrogenase maturation protease [Pseudomonadota bacterium]